MTETAAVTVVSCLYGSGYDKFVDWWARSIAGLDPQPAEVILATEKGVVQDLSHPVYQAKIFAPICDWRHPQAFYLDYAINHALNEWVWILDLDDVAFPDALAGIDEVAADVWQMGYERSDGVTHIPPQLTAAEFLQQPGNPFTGASAGRTDAFRRVGGFPDVAFQDFGLWRRLALAGATFESSGRTHFRYNLHDRARAWLELVPDRRLDHLAEMMESETSVA